MDETLIVNFDGGSRGNPGPAGIGVVVSAMDGVPIVTLGKFIGKATNNVAEYKALILGMSEALKLGAKKIIIRGDSELIIKQMRGEYRVKNPDMKVLYDEAQTVIRQFQSYKIEHNLRHKNELADKLANLAMDRKGDVTETTGSVKQERMPIDEPTPEMPKAEDRHACPTCGCVIRIEQPTRIRPHQVKPFVCQCGTKMGQV